MSTSQNKKSNQITEGMLARSARGTRDESDEGVNKAAGTKSSSQRELTAQNSGSTQDQEYNNSCLAGVD